MAGDHEEGQNGQIRQDAVSRPGDNALLIAMSAGVTRAIGGKEDGRQHTDHAQGSGQAHVADENTIEHGADDGCGRRLLGDLVRRGRCDIALQRLVVLQYIHHVAQLQPFVFETFEVFRFIVL